MIEISAVIQEILISAQATTLRLDIAASDMNSLGDLVDQELTVTMAPKPAPQPARPKRLTQKGAQPECA